MNSHNQFPPLEAMSSLKSCASYSRLPNFQNAATNNLQKFDSWFYFDFCLFLYALIQRIPNSSLPSDKSAAKIAVLTSVTSGFVIGQVNPAWIAIAINTELTYFRSGRPKETLLTPMVILTPNSSATILIVSSVIYTVSWFAPMVIARGSMTISSN